MTVHRLSDPAASQGEPVACHDCDLLQTLPHLQPGESAHCLRCGSLLARNPPDSIDRTLALLATAAVLFVIANTWPLVGLDLSGRRTEVTLFGAVHALWQLDMKPVAALVFFTAMLFPVLEMLMIGIVLIPLRMGRRLPGLALFFRMASSLRPWGMAEVFMLGMLVSLVKLSHLATVLLGPAFWALAALIVVLTIEVRAFDTRLLWAGAR